MRHVTVLLLTSSLAIPAAAEPAQSAPAMQSEHRLSPEEVERILAEASRKPEMPQSADDAANRQIHGEIGFSIGTGGYRSAFGTAVVPLSGDGVAILSLGTDNLGPVRIVDHRER